MRGLSFRLAYVFEAPVENLQLLFGELGLLLQFVHAFRPVAHGGELKVIFYAVCARHTHTHSGKHYNKHVSVCLMPYSWHSIMTTTTNGAIKK